MISVAVDYLSLPSHSQPREFMRPINGSRMMTLVYLELGSLGLRAIVALALTDLLREKHLCACLAAVP